MKTYQLCARMIALGRTAGLQDKLDAFLLSGSITVDEYTELCRQLAGKEEN